MPRTNVGNGRSVDAELAHRALSSAVSGEAVHGLHVSRARRVASRSWLRPGAAGRNVGRRIAGMMRSIVVAVFLSLPAVPVFADDAAEANRLMVEAVRDIRHADLEPSAEGKFALLKRAHGKLLAIVQRYPSTDLAVKLATGQRVGNISLAAVGAAMERARPSRRPQPGAPRQVWRHEEGVVALAMPSGRRWAWSVGGDGVGVLRDVATGKVLRTWRHPKRPSAAAISPDGKRVLTADRYGGARLVASETTEVLSSWDHDRSVASVTLSRDRRKALVGAGNEALLIDVRALEVLRIWRHRAPATVVAWSPDGRLILAGFADGTALLGAAGSGKTLHKWEHEGSGGGGVTSAAFSADGRRVLTGAANWRAVLRDTATGRTLREWQVGQKVTTVALSRDGRWALTGDDGWEVELHDVRGGRTVRKWRYESWPRAVAFSADSRQAFMGFADGTAIVCDIHIPANRGNYKRTFLSSDGGCW